MSQFSVSDIPVIFEDQHILVVSKPAGLPTQATVDRRRACLYNLLLESKNWPYLGLHHRLDMPTSGLVLLTKNKQSNKPVAALFKDRQIQKTYLAIATGQVSQTKFSFECYLKQKKTKSGKTLMEVVRSGGDFSQTDFECLRQGKKIHLIECLPRTGRMHQIRIHLKTLGLPICGDALYGNIDSRFPRLMLHAYKLQFDHPITKQNLILTAPEPKDFLQAQSFIVATQT